MKTYKVEINEEGNTRWYNEANQLHRENNLPAVELADGYKAYYFNGERHRENGPAVEGGYGYKAYYFNGKLHRENNLPAVEHIDGSKFYYLNGERHRENGPAVEYANGNKAYYLNDKELSEEEFNNQLRPLVGTKTIINGVEYTLS